LSAIIVRGLNRTYEIDEAWSASPLAFLRTTPELATRTSLSERIVIEAADGHFRARLPGGRAMNGTLRSLAAQLDSAILREALAADAATPVLSAALLRDPGGKRVALLGRRKTGKSWLSVALLRAGWRFEGDALAWVRPEGVLAQPRTIRLRDPLRGLPPTWRDFAEICPCLEDIGGQEVRAVDPRVFGGDWTIRLGGLDAILLLELNPGGRGALRPVDTTRAFRAVLDVTYGRIVGRSAALMRELISTTPVYRLRVGALDEAVDRVARALY
jgi:hypothetical protein